MVAPSSGRGSSERSLPPRRTQCQRSGRPTRFFKTDVNHTHRDSRTKDYLSRQAGRRERSLTVVPYKCLLARVQLTPLTAPAIAKATVQTDRCPSAVSPSRFANGHGQNQSSVYSGVYCQSVLQKRHSWPRSAAIRCSPAVTASTGVQACSTSSAMRTALRRTDRRSRIRCPRNEKMFCRYVVVRFCRRHRPGLTFRDAPAKPNAISRTSINVDVSTKCSLSH